LTALGFSALSLNCDEPFPNSDFNLNLRHYIPVQDYLWRPSPAPMNGTEDVALAAGAYTRPLFSST
jgi:hypothetical protein